MYESIKTKNERELQEKIIEIIEKYIISAIYVKSKYNSVNRELIQIPNNIEKKILKQNIRKCVNLGVNTSKFLKIINTMKQNKNGRYSLLNIFINPFDFIDNDIGSLISIKCCDKIVKEFKLKIDKNERVEKFIISLFSDTIYIPSNKFNEKIIEYFKTPNDLNTNKAFIKKFLKNNIKRKKIKGEFYMTTIYLDNLQQKLTNDVMELYYNKKYDYDKPQLTKFIETYETEKNYTLSDKQKKSIHNLINNKLGVLTGYPGSGKTDILDCVCQYLQKYHHCDNISLTAPTGLATNNLVDRCNIIKNPEINFNLYKLLYHVFDTINYSYNLTDLEKNKKINLFENELTTNVDINKDIEKKIKKINFSDNLPKLIVVDEASMINLRMFVYLIYLCKTYDLRLILAGDVNQLPSIGGGNPFKDIIDSFKFKINKLDTIYRNNGNLTDVIMNMNFKIITNKSFIDNTFTFIPIKNFIKDNDINYDMLNNLITSNNLSKYNTKFLTPQSDYTFGFINLNKKLQQIYNNQSKIINPWENTKFNSLFKDNDLVIKTINSYDENDVCEANGDTGKIMYDGNTININYDRYKNTNKQPTKIKLIDLKNEFKLAYALSIHKAQGQGYQNIVIFISKSHSMWSNNDSKNLLYTAISRASKKCIIIGDYDLFIRAQKSTIINPSKFMKFKTI